MRYLLYILLFPFIANAQFPASGGAASYSSMMSPKWGALINGSHTTAQRAQIALLLKCTHVRMSIKATTWDGNSEAFDVYESAGLKIVLDIDSADQEDPRPYPKNMTNLANFATSVLNQHTPAILVYGNEPLNQPANAQDTNAYYFGPLSDYVLGLQTLSAICRARNIPFTCGGIGLNGDGMFVLVRRWAATKYSETVAASFAANTIVSGRRNGAKTPGTNASVDYEARQQDTILNAAQYLDYINIHTYEIIDPDITNDSVRTAITANVWRYVKEYIEERTSKPCITNELGVRGNTQPALVTNMINELYRLGFSHVLWYSGTGNANPPAMPLHNMLWDGVSNPLLANGTAFSNAPPVTQSSEQ